MPEKTIYQDARKAGVSRRDFLKLSGLLAATLGLNTMPPIAESGLPLNMGKVSRPEALITKAMESKPRLPVIWLEFQDCTGCTEAVSRANAPTLSNLVLNTLTIEYHETLSAAAGFQVEEAKQQAMKKYAGQYILVVEGSIPVGDEALYCVIGGRTGEEILKEAAAGAAAIIAVGNCSSFGGLPKAKPNPTNAKGVWEIITDKPVVNIPGCPAIPEATVGVIAHFALFGALPELDGLHRPKTFYGVTVHDRCLRRPFYEAGKLPTPSMTKARKKAIAYTNWAVKVPLPITPVPQLSGMQVCLFQFSLDIPAWVVPNQISGMAAGSIRVNQLLWTGLR